MRIKYQLQRPFRLIQIIGIISKCRLWMLYVDDPLKFALIQIMHDAAQLVYGIMRYRWMPKYTYKPPEA